MPRKKKPALEILTPSAALVPQQPGARIEEMIERMVQQRVDEMLLAQYATLKDISPEVQRHKSMFERQFPALYYAKWGCIECKTKKAVYSSQGRCAKCSTRFALRKAALKREFDREHPLEIAGVMDQVTRRVRSAERLLGRQFLRKGDTTMTEGTRTTVRLIRHGEEHPYAIEITTPRWRGVDAAFDDGGLKVPPDIQEISNLLDQAGVKRWKGSDGKAGMFFMADGTTEIIFQDADDFTLAITTLHDAGWLSPALPPMPPADAPTN